MTLEMNCFRLKCEAKVMLMRLGGDGHHRTVFKVVFTFCEVYIGLYIGWSISGLFSIVSGILEAFH